MSHALRRLSVAVAALGFAIMPAQAQSARGTITGTLDGEVVTWRMSADGSGIRYLGEGDASASMGGEPWTAPEGVGAISISLDLSDGLQRLMLLEIISKDGDAVLWRADEDSSAVLEVSHRHLTDTTSRVKGDLSVTLDPVATTGAGPELVIKLNGMLTRHGH